MIDLKSLSFRELLDYRNDLIVRIDDLENQVNELMILWNCVKLDIVRRDFEENKPLLD